ncbi:hypothetical protein ABEW03_16110 [Virgibacillus pantothenticus]|uniref:hypothetical protein n=1 Tax=Virgibacillus pantothenticus TaxID=1473 RepID=UPI003D29F729
MARDGGVCNTCGKQFISTSEVQRKNISKVASQIRRDIFWKSIEHCKDISPEQIETLLKLFEQYKEKDDMQSKPSIGSENCNHKYEVITNNINITEVRTGNVLDIEVNGYILFYCSKCLDIQKKVIT